MKHIFLVFALIAGFTVSAQSTEKLLKSNKWFANAAVGETTIVLTKKAPSKSVWDAKFDKKGSMNFCSALTSPIIDPQGKEIKAGEYYCDPSYTYEITGDVLKIKFPLVDWLYKIKSLSNGDLELSSIKQQ